MLIFVYGTLKRGFRLHGNLAGQRFVSGAKTKPLYRLYSCGDYPGMVECCQQDSNSEATTLVPSNLTQDAGVSIEGELWEVCDLGLDLLDEVEGVSFQLFERREVHLREPQITDLVQAYFFLPSVAEFEECGPVWN